MAIYVFIAILIVMVGVLSFIMSRIIHRMNEIDQQQEMVVQEFARLTGVAREDAEKIVTERLEKAEGKFKKTADSINSAIQRIDGEIADINRREIGTADTSEFSRLKNKVLNEYGRRLHALEKKLKEREKDPVEYQDGLMGVHIAPDAVIDEGGKEENDLHEE